MLAQENELDTLTRYTFAVSMRTKSAKSVADSVSEFVGMLDYFRKVEIVSDNEPVIVSGIKQAQMLRSRSGLETIVQLSKSFDKGRTAIAERTIQTVRAQSRTLVNYVEHQIGAKFPDSHPMTQCVASEQISCAQFIGLYSMSELVLKALQRKSSKLRTGHAWYFSEEDEV